MVVDHMILLNQKLEKHLEQEILIFEQQKDMPYITNIEKSGIEKGSDQEREKMVINMHRHGMSADDIAKVSELDLAQVKGIIKKSQDSK